LSACRYLASRKIILYGGDTSADAGPVSDVSGSVSLCHIELQPRHGIWALENLDFEPLLQDKVYEFMFVWAPLKMVGATGSPGNPVALY
jgi:kynurenine formamidase